MAIFPGVRDTYDQLDKIFKAIGTPTEDDWCGVTRLPGYKPHKLGFYPQRKLGLSWPRLHDVVQGEAMATALLQLDPANRIGADDAMCHLYFNGLPKKLLELPDGECDFFLGFFSVFSLWCCFFFGFLFLLLRGFSSDD